MIDIKVVPQAGGEKDFVELFQGALKIVRTEKVIAVGYFICTEAEDLNDFTGNSRALTAGSATLSQDIDRSIRGE